VKRTAILKYRGGLGNQLFQWVFGHYVAKTHEVFQDTSWFSAQVQRSFELHELQQHCDHMKRHGSRSTFKASLQSRMVGFPNRNTILDDTNFNSDFWKSIPKLSIEGYFQSEVNMESAGGSWLNELRSHISELTLDGLSVNIAEATVVHVRRGDYLRPEVKKNIGTLDDIFFSRQIDEMQGDIVILCERVSDIRALIGDLREKRQILVLDDSLLNSWSTLQAISKAKYFIGSNSSLSWWGAFLRSKEGKKSSLPSRWTESGRYAHPGKTNLTNCEFKNSIWMD
jgi:Glycosyl transferase family 11